MYPRGDLGHRDGFADSGLCQSQEQTVEGTSYTEEQDTVPAPSLSCPLKAV